MKFLAICLLGILVLPRVRLQKTKPSSPGSTCHEFAFDARIRGGEEYSHELGGGLFLRLTPSLAPPNENWGWVIQVQPQDSNDDYAWPVNPPFHFGNSQWLATGYNESAQQQLSHEHEVFFVLNKEEYERATKLANDALNHSDPEAAGRFLAILPTLRSAVLSSTQCNSLLGHAAPNSSKEPPQENGSVSKSTAACAVEMRTDAEGVDFNAYLRDVYLSVKKRWFANMPPAIEKGQQGTNTVEFRILRDGSVLKDSVKMVASSEKSDFDAASLQGIQEAIPFTHLPEKFSKPFIVLRFNFYYNLPLPRNPH